jgi:REP-associated tyrosine transposase
LKEFVYKERTERNLPHIHTPRATLFVTFRLAGTVPKPLLRFYHAQRKWLDEETKRLVRLKLEDDSREMRAHEARFLDFQRGWFVKFEEILHRAECGPTWLKDETIAQIVADSLHNRDGKVYRLDAYSIMSNHVHPPGSAIAPFSGRVPSGKLKVTTILFVIAESFNGLLTTS